MKYFSSRVHAFSGSLILCVVMTLSACAATTFADASLAHQASRPRKVSGVPQPKARVKPEPKPKVLSVREIKEAKEKLKEFGYWLTKDEDSYRQAVVAFQKVNELKRTGKLTYQDLEILRNAQPSIPKETKNLEEGKIRVEIDLRRQILFVINHENQVTRILTISSGNDKEFKSEGFVRDAITPPGRFNVYNKIKGWRKSALGLLYYPNYFLSGLAIHGSKFVPPYPDSHGCIRIPMFAAEEFYQMVVLGTEILVYVSRPPEEGSSAGSQAK